MRHLGARVAQALVQRRARRFHAQVVALYGDLGAGKTTFTQGFLRGLGITRKVASPTFVLMKRYPLRLEKFSAAFHLDCYRLRSLQEIVDLGTRELLRNPELILLIEWPEKLVRLLPKGTVKLRFRHGRQEHERNVSITNLPRF